MNQQQLSEFIKPHADPKYIKTTGLTFEGTRKKLANLSIVDQLGWITVYKSMIQEDIPKLTNYYAKRLEKHLSVYSVSNMCKEFNTTWQYYQPFNHKSIQKILLNHIESHMNSEHCKDIIKYLPEILVGTQINSSYAKDLLKATSTALMLAYSRELYLSSTLEDLYTHQYKLDGGYGNNTLIETTEMLLKGLPIFNLLIDQMSQSDREYSQLLILVLTNQKDLIMKQKHLSHYTTAVSLITDNVSIKDTMTIPRGITMNISMDTTVSMPEMLMEQYG